MTTWYARPSAAHGGSNAGSSYENAWQAWSSIVWGVGGVVAGDTLYICGAHSSATTLTVGAHGGGSGTEAVLRGDYAGDPGSISITAAGQYLSLRSHTNFIDLEMSGVSRVMLAGSSLVNNYWLGCTFNGGTNPIIELDASNGTAHADIRFELCTFNGGASAAAGGGAAIHWFVAATGAVSTLSRISVRYCTFRDCNALGTGRAVIHLRSESDVSTSSVLSDLLLEYNTFDGFIGFAVEATEGHSTFGLWRGVRAIGNTILNGTENSSTLGGAFSLTGFDHSTTAGFGTNYFSQNTIKNVVGRAGAFNFIYGSYAAAFNLAEDLSTTSVDACGVLFDHGCFSCSATGNTFRRLTGKAGVNNSGVGLMVLDDVSKCSFSGNIVDGALCGVFFGDPGSGVDCVVTNNTFVNLTTYGVIAGSTSNIANSVVKNNIFTGEGYSVRDLGSTTWTAEDYNCFYGFASGASNHTLGANSITADPLLDADYRPRAGSPCIDAGALIDGVVLKDFYGKDITASPDIGAVQRYAARAASASRSAITRSTITRSVHDRRAVCG